MTAKEHKTTNRVELLIRSNHGEECYREERDFR